MISADYCRLMARYNRWQNESLYAAAEGIGAAARREERGAFFGSIHGTLSHLLWGDMVWMSRFDGGDRPDCGIAESPRLFDDWQGLWAERRAMDDRIVAWAGDLTGGALAGPLAWHSAVLGREIERPIALCIVHFFNHQTHHRGQAHAMLTASGARPDDTDIVIMPGL